MPHTNHPAIIRRLKRADGHLQTIIEMIEEDRTCLEIAQQLQAVESAIENAKKALIHDQISQCLERPLKATGPAGRAYLKEFKLIAKYL
jgi:DNA-binding FrmR family transcriptional regulator